MAVQYFKCDQHQWIAHLKWLKRQILLYIVTTKNFKKGACSQKFHKAKNYKWPKCTSTGKWIKKLRYSHTIYYYLTIKRNELLIYARNRYIWNTEQKTTFCITALVGSSRTGRIHLWRQQAEQRKEARGGGGHHGGSVPRWWQCLSLDRAGICLAACI